MSKKKQCNKILEAYQKSDDQLIILSLFTDVECGNINEEIEYLKDSSELHKNKDKLLNVIENVHKNKLKCCMYCSENFSKIADLKKHIVISCFFKELEKENKLKEESGDTINNDNSINTNCNNTSNVHGNHNIVNSNNVTNIYLEIKTPVPFDEDWDISKINIEKLSNVLLSKIMFTGLLEEILKNEINLNVIIDKNNDSGMVYKNDLDKYIHMKSKDIVDNTMIKLKKHLTDIGHHKAKELYLDEPLNMCVRIAEKKYDDYLKNAYINTGVKKLVTNMYDATKNDAINISKNVIDNNINHDIDNGFY